MITTAFNYKPWLGYSHADYHVVSRIQHIVFLFYSVIYSIDIGINALSQNETCEFVNGVVIKDGQ